MASIFEFFKRGLQKTKTSLMRRISGIFGGEKAWDQDTYDELEAALVSTDLGVNISGKLVAEVKDRYERGLIKTGEDIMAVAKDSILKLLSENGQPEINHAANGPTVIMMVGVNGSGKTTSVAKLAHYFMKQGKSVLLGAGDTFRAAGVEQDAAAVAFDAVRSGTQKGVDYVIIDTAGRQHTRRDLMDELAKVKRIIGKECPEAPHEIWLTVDSSIGTNALIQAREFGKLFPITGLILTKLDGTGKGGVVVAIKQELGYPVRFIGLGEQVDDLQPFDQEAFVKALFE